jgi:hypothetical protein
MKAILVLGVLAASGCGAILNSSTVTVNGPQGTEVDGASVPATVNQKGSHQVVMPDGRRCVLTSDAAAKYIILDILFTGLIGIVVDAATGDWKTLNSDGCPGVTVN